MSFLDEQRGPSRSMRRLGVSLAAVAGVVTVIGLTSSPASAQVEKRVRFDCATSPTTFNWTAPQGVSSVSVEVAGAAGGDDPGESGRGGRGAVIKATVDVTSPANRITGEIGCSGDEPRPQGIPGGTGGAPVGAANPGGSGGGGTYVFAGTPSFTRITAQIYAGGGGGGGGRGSGFGINAGGDGGDAGSLGLAAVPGRDADGGALAGGGSGGNTANGGVICVTLPTRRGADGQNATGPGAGGGAGGGGAHGGCGGGAGFRIEDRPGFVTIGSGGGGESGASSVSGAVESVNVQADSRKDGYVVITYAGR
jgi:hypothetical protein